MTLSFDYFTVFEILDTREMQTLDKKLRIRLEFNWQSLSQLIKSNEELMTELHKTGCITFRQREVIEKQPSSQQIKKLMEIMSRKSVAYFDKFISCLPEAAKLRVRSPMENVVFPGNVLVLC